MGLYFSCPFWDQNDLEDSLESIVVKSISLGDDQVKTFKRTLSFKGQGSDQSKILKSLGSGKMVVEGSVSFKKRDNETTISINPPCTTEGGKLLGRLLSKSSSINLVEDQLDRSVSHSSVLDSGSPKHEAALKLQKVYKSFRTRRKLADCAVLVEQSWWELLDFAELKHSSISFFDIEHHETAMSRWSRAKTRAAKVGKGLSKNEKAQKLALQHWLEAIDPRHRYGHNLHFYYVKWLQSHSREPFFYWLDIGEGKEVHLEKCPRSKLQQQCIKYLGPMERLAYEVCVEDGKMFYKQSGELLDSGMDPHAKWIFVLSASKSLYVGKKKKGTFQHSSFLAGGATSAAGRLVVENGRLQAVWPHSGHYRPTPENFEEFISFLRENNVDLSNVKMDPADDEELSSVETQKNSLHWRNNSYEEEIGQEKNVTSTFEDVSEEKTSSSSALLVEEEEGTTQDLVSVTEKQPKFRFSRRGSLTKKLTKIMIPGRDELCRKMHDENASSTFYEEADICVRDGSGASHGELDESVSDDDDEAANEYEIIPEESILKRINSHKGTKSYQLGKQLSCKWTTGAGPRISCVRDYPSKLQFHALEKVSLSPRSVDCRRKSVFGSDSWGRLSQKGLMTPKCGEFEVPERTKSSPLIDS